MEEGATLKADKFDFYFLIFIFILGGFRTVRWRNASSLWASGQRYK